VPITTELVLAVSEFVLVMARLARAIALSIVLSPMARSSRIGIRLNGWHGITFT
jgi:hypothetical protein